MEKQPYTHSRGFTLVEMLVVVVIAGILASIAYPTYREHVMSTRRAAAQTTLADAATRQEQFYLDNRSYAGAITTQLNMSTLSDGGFYSLAVFNATDCPIATCYEMRAIPQGTQSSDKCSTLAIDSEGTRTPSGCWQ